MAKFIEVTTLSGAKASINVEAIVMIVEECNNESSMIIASAGYKINRNLKSLANK